MLVLSLAMEPDSRQGEEGEDKDKEEREDEDEDEDEGHWDEHVDPDSSGYIHQFGYAGGEHAGVYEGQNEGTWDYEGGGGYEGLGGDVGMGEYEDVAGGSHYTGEHEGRLDDGLMGLFQYEGQGAREDAHEHEDELEQQGEEGGVEFTHGRCRKA
jgi:hypothetical protein